MAIECSNRSLMAYRCAAAEVAPAHGRAAPPAGRPPPRKRPPRPPPRLFYLAMVPSTPIFLSVLVLMSSWVSSSSRELLAPGSCGSGRRLAQEACGAAPGAPCCCQPVQGRSWEGRSAPRALVAVAGRRAPAAQRRTERCPTVGRSTLPVPATLLFSKFFAQPFPPGPPRYYGCCRSPALFCHFFDFTPPGIPGACPQPSLCLEIPPVRPRAR